MTFLTFFVLFFISTHVNYQITKTYSSGKNPQWPSNTGNLKQSNKCNIEIKTNLKFSRQLLLRQYELDKDKYKVSRAVIDSENNIICVLSQDFGTAMLAKFNFQGYSVRIPIETGINCGPNLSNDDQIIFGYNNIITCLNKDLEINWTYTCSSELEDSMIVTPEGDIIFYTHSMIYKLNRFGKKQWEYKVSNKISSRLCVDQNSNLIFSTNMAEVYSINSEGKLNWKKIPNLESKNYIYTSKISLADDGSTFCLAYGVLTKWDKEAKKQWEYRDKDFGITNSNDKLSAEKFYLAIKDENTVVVKSPYQITQVKNGKLDWKIDNLELTINSIPIIDKNNRLFLIDAFSQGNALGAFENETYSTVYTVEDNGKYIRSKQEKVKGYYSPKLKYPIITKEGDVLISDNLHLYSKYRTTIIYLWINSKRVNVDCKWIELEDSPFLFKNRTFVPLRFIAEAFGGVVDWNNMQRSITITIRERNIEIELFLDRNIALVNGKEYKLDVQPVIVNGRTFVPLRFISESIGCKIEFTAPSTITIILEE